VNGSSIIKFLPRPLLLIGILALGVGIFLKWPRPQSETRDSIEYTTFVRTHLKMIDPFAKAWNAKEENRKVNTQLVELGGLSQLVMNSLYSGRGFTDMLEIEVGITSRVFAAPLDSIKFRDLTGPLLRDGLMDRINPPSFSPWTRQGRIYGIPKDVHPVLLAYRADLIEEAGLSLEGVETWDEFAERLRPLIQDYDGDGHIDRYLINFWPTMSPSILSLYIRQANPEIVSPEGAVTINTPQIAETVTNLIQWCVGPHRIATDVNYFSAAGYQLMLDGYVVAFPVADWYTEILDTYLPSLKGKMKLMPLPAWEPGGRRTSVWGGTMITFYDDGDHFEESWEFMKALTFDRERAREKYRETGIITPISDYWDDPVFDQPDPYFSNQPRGRLFIEQAPDVPPRYTTPYFDTAFNMVLNIMIEMLKFAESNSVHDKETLFPLVMERLDKAQNRVDLIMDRNPYFP